IGSDQQRRQQPLQSEYRRRGLQDALRAPRELQQRDIPGEREQRVDQHLRGPALDRWQHAAHHQIHAQVSADGQREQQRRGRQVLEVLLPLTGLVRPVFDTQIAAALTGLPAQIGYAEAVRRLLGRELAKSHTRTDWSRRPLSPAQIEYALDDVRYLLPLAARLQEQLARLGRLDWLAEELAALEDPGALTIEPDNAWLRIKGLRDLDPARARLARALAAWRERCAVEHDRPRGWILDDTLLREIVVQVPRTLQALAQIAAMPPGLVKRRGEELLAQVRAAEVPHPAPPPVARARSDPFTAALVKK